MARTPRKKARAARQDPPRDLTKGVIVVLSGGAADGLNPQEVRDRMDQYIADVNADPFVQANTGGQGLTFKLFQPQPTSHLHQAQWRDICNELSDLEATPLILVGHSNGGAAAMNLARCIASQGKSVDLIFSADSILTLDDIGNINQVPPNVKLNFNSYVIPTPAWILAPFPIGDPNTRQADGSLDGILNIGLTYNLPGAVAHRNAFYHLAGGDKGSTGFQFPQLMLAVTLGVLRGETNFQVIENAKAPLQTLATKARVTIELETTNFKKTLRR